MSKRMTTFATLATGATAILGALTATAAAQAPPVSGGPTYTLAIRAQERHVAGRIAAIDPVRKNVVILDEGTRLTVPEILPLKQEALQPGAAVRATYEVRDGQNVVTSMEVTRVSVTR
jgi:hypothetical protein